MERQRVPLVVEAKRGLPFLGCGNVKGCHVQVACLMRGFGFADLYRDKFY